MRGIFTLLPSGTTYISACVTFHVLLNLPAAAQAGASKVALQTHGKKDAGIVLWKVWTHLEPALQIKLLSSALL